MARPVTAALLVPVVLGQCRQIILASDSVRLVIRPGLV